METSMQTARPIARTLHVGRLILYAIICVISIVVFVTLHELFHLVVGLLLGLPAHLISPVSAGVSREAARHADGWRLAVMNGIAPLLTMILGVIVALLLTRFGRSWPDILNRFFSWWAILGIPYIGFEMMGTSNPTDYAGTGADPAAVAGFLGISDPVRALVSFVALLFFLISGLFLTTTLAAVEGLPHRPLPRFADYSITPLLWRRILATILIAAVFIIGIVGATGAAQGNHYAFSATELLGPLLWAIALSLLVIWQRPFTHILRNMWIFPLLLAWVVFIIGGILTNASDYLGIGLYLLSPIILTALVREGTSAS